MSSWIKKEAIFTNRYPLVSSLELEKALQASIERVIQNVNEFGGNQFPTSTSKNYFYTYGENREWTTGFWSGEVWLSYENAQDDLSKALLRKVAEENIYSFEYRIDHQIDVEHHDMGFLYILSCVAGHQLIDSKIGKQAALKAAENLVSRYQNKGEFIQAWGKLNAPDNYRLIIDCLLNVPLLFWATRETEEARFAEIAEKHIETTFSYVLREDGSTWHTIFFDQETGEFQRGQTSQGYKNTSAWSRGQSWGIYGAALAYKNLQKPEYMDIFRKTSNFFLEHLPDDLCPFWDFTFGNGDEKNEPRDSSAAVIAVCGFLEMAKYLDEKEADYYITVSKKIMKSLIDTYQVSASSTSNGQLKGGTYARKTLYNECRNNGLNECTIWGDYFFMEALQRLINPEWKIYW